MTQSGTRRRTTSTTARSAVVLAVLAVAWTLAGPADAEAQTVTVTVDIAGTGSGGVTSSPSAITCSGSNTSCSAGFTGGAAVTLTATPDSGKTFVGWTGICSGTGTCQFNAVDGALAVAQFDSPTAAAVTYYHLDAIGSVRALTDGSGTVLIRHDYFPFGEDTQAMTGDPLRFTGQEIDAESGQHYFQARQYRNIWGRFTTVDPGHVNGSLEDPQGWNGYAYARNNPFKYIDPDGLAYRVCPLAATTCDKHLLSQERYDDYREGRGGIYWTDGEAWAERADLYKGGYKYAVLHYVLQSEDVDYALEEVHRTTGPTINFLGAVGVAFAGAAGALEGLTYYAAESMVALGRLWVLPGALKVTETVFRFSEYYYDRLWRTGRPFPHLTAYEVLRTATKVERDIRAGYYRYSNDIWEMIYNPATRDVYHLQPLKR